LSPASAFTRLLETALLVAALGIAATLSGVAAMRLVLAAQEVAVPTLVDLRVAEAGGLTARSRLLLRVEGKRHDPRVPAEHIAAQEPLPGTTLKAQRSVRVWVSLGPKLVDVPAVEGQSLRTARLSLDQAHVAVVTTTEIPNPAVEGTIVQQQPAAGPADGTAVAARLLVSSGSLPAAFVMPDLIGRSAGSVAEALRAAGLRVEDLRPRSYPGVPPGTVLRQVPAAGHRVTSGTSVTLEVSKVG
jgi:eukaryotic-like serine/threonine-protein kinase